MKKRRRQNNPFSFESHDFYCMECGKKGIPLPRSKGRGKEENHIKHLWCIHCQMRTPHREIRNMEEEIKRKREENKEET